MGLDCMINTGCNAILVGASGYGLYSLDASSQAYAYLLCAFALLHGLMGLMRSIGKGEEDDCNRIQRISKSFMDLLALPLANMQLYNDSSQSSYTVLHGLSLIIFVYDLMGMMNDDSDEATEAIKDLSILANIASNIFLAKQEDKPIYGALAVSTLLMNYGSPIIGFVMSCENFTILGNAAIVGTLTYTLTGGESGGGSGSSSKTG